MARRSSSNDLDRSDGFHRKGSNGIDPRDKSGNDSEEGTWAAWLYDLLKPTWPSWWCAIHARTHYSKDGNKSDWIDARKLTELLYLNKLSPVYHGETGMRMLGELARSYLTIVKDTARVMSG